MSDAFVLILIALVILVALWLGRRGGGGGPRNHPKDDRPAPVKRPRFERPPGMSGEKRDEKPGRDKTEKQADHPGRGPKR